VCGVLYVCCSLSDIMSAVSSCALSLVSLEMSTNKTLDVLFQSQN